ncbi:MAG: prepilin-type N-terminal cleavage/methylation domain-containing protein [Lentisphaerae bacterium]|nr:prepilin-type N-terminal cleavage/methylation domain-containing protein [Lentisphaerota bacterium]
MKKRHNFTLVEMLTVIAIIAILAGIVTPVVIISKQRGLKSRAESEITSIISALKQLDADYGKVLKKTATANTYEIGSQTVTAADDIATVTGDAYNAMIAELSAPKNSAFTTVKPVSVNKRKKVYLEPQKGFNPAEAYTGQTGLLYRDPWGNPYKIMVKVTKDDELKLNATKTIVGNYAVYSFGPDKKDNNGCSADLDVCISTGDHKNHDDIASWNL